MTTETSICPPHHWLLPQAAGETSIGVCRLCGASKEMSNNLEGALRTNAKGKPANQAGTPVRGMADAGFVTPWEPGLLR